MVSNAFDSSRNIFIGISFKSILLMILSISSSAAYSVECLGLKPYWLGKKDHIPQNTMITVCV